MESLSHIFSSFVKIHYKGEILFCNFGGEHLWETVWLGSQKKKSDGQCSCHLPF